MSPTTYIHHAKAEGSYWPILVAFSIILLAIGVLVHVVISAVAIFLLLIAIAGWIQENRTVTLARNGSHD
ncbi:MAG: cytochrome c oxidase subunit 4 [Caldilineaceae bacterium]